jgi:hypothetical protein
VSERCPGRDINFVAGRFDSGLRGRPGFLSREYSLATPARLQLAPTLQFGTTFYLTGE